MADTIPLGQPLQSRLKPNAPRAGSVQWPSWCMIAGITFSLIGVHNQLVIINNHTWDIRGICAIGRDTFGHRRHIMIRSTGVLVGIGVRRT